MGILHSLDDWKSTFGNFFTLCLGLVAWSSKKQELVVLSSIEVEYIVATLACAQALWLKKIVEEFDEAMSSYYHFL